MPSTPSSAPPDPPPRGRRGLLGAIAAVVVLVVAGVTVTVSVLAGNGTDPANSSRADSSVVDAVESATIAVGQPAPDFTLPNLNGNGEVRLSDLRGQPVVLNFWASWCHPCRQEFPLLAAAERRYGDDGLEIVGVTYRDIASDSRKFARDQDAQWTLARDDRGMVAKPYGVRAVPQTFFIDADGVVKARVFGITSADDLDQTLKKILPRSAR